jgi:hypothetical protein
VFYVNLGIRLWSFFDAVNIAKVNNLFFRDQDKTSLDLNLLPYIGSPDYFQLHEEIPVGLTLFITF